MSDDYIPGSPEDYYLELTDQDGTIRYSGVRAKIRFLAELHDQVIKNTTNSEGNAYTASLDFNDKLAEFIRSAPVEAQVVFYDVFTQEVQAITSKTNDETAKLIGEADKTEATASAIGQWIGAAVLLVFFLVVVFNI